MKKPLFSRLGQAIAPWRKKQGFQPATPTTKSWRETTEGIYLGLDDFLHDKTGHFSPALRVISLAAFRDAVGEDWDRLKDRVMMIAESIIQRRIGSGNAFAQQGEELFILCYASSIPDAQARSKAEKITEEIGRKLIGAQFSGVERPLVHMASVDKDEMLNPDGTLDLGALADEIHAVRKEAGDLDIAPVAKSQIAALEAEAEEIGARFHESQGGADRDSWGDGRSFLGEDEETGDAPDGQRFRDGDPDALGDSDPWAKDRSFMKDGEPLPETGPEGQRFHAAASGDAAAQDPWAKDRSFMKGGAPTTPKDEGPARSYMTTSAAMGSGTAVAEPTKPDITLTFRPIWAAGSERIDACVAVPQTRPVFSDPDAAAAYDAAYLEAVMGHLDSLSKGVTLIASVRFTSFAVHRRPPLIEALQTQSMAFRNDRLILEATDIPADAGPDDVALTVKAMAAQAGAVYLRLTPNSSGAVKAATGTGARALGVDLTGVGEDLETPVMALKRDVHAASEEPEALYAWGLDRRAGLKAGLNARLDFISGAVLLKPAPRPGPPVRLARDKIVAALSKKKS